MNYGHTLTYHIGPGLAELFGSAHPSPSDTHGKHMSHAYTGIDVRHVVQLPSASNRQTDIHATLPGKYGVRMPPVPYIEGCSFTMDVGCRLEVSL